MHKPYLPPIYLSINLIFTLKPELQNKIYEKIKNKKEITELNFSNLENELSYIIVNNDLPNELDKVLVDGIELINNIQPQKEEIKKVVNMDKDDEYPYETDQYKNESCNPF